jgi:hypothetical protein
MIVRAPDLGLPADPAMAATALHGTGSAAQRHSSGGLTSARRMKEAAN